MKVDVRRTDSGGAHTAVRVHCDLHPVTSVITAACRASQNRTGIMEACANTAGTQYWYTSILDTIRLLLLAD